MLFLFYKTIKCSERQWLKQSLCFSHRNYRSHWHLFVAVPQGIDVSFLHLSSYGYKKYDDKSSFIIVWGCFRYTLKLHIQIFVGEAQGGRIKKEHPQTSSFPFFQYKPSISLMSISLSTVFYISAEPRLLGYSQLGRPRGRQKNRIRGGGVKHTLRWCAWVSVWDECGCIFLKCVGLSVCVCTYVNYRRMMRSLTVINDAAVTQVR